MAPFGRFPTMKISEQIQFARSRLYLKDLTERYGVFRLHGPDTAGFLQNVTTNDVKELALGEGCPNAILDKRSAIIALFQNYHMDGCYIVVSERSLIADLRDHFNSLLFTEEVNVEKDDDSSVFTLQGPDAPALLSGLSEGVRFSGESTDRAAMISLDGIELLVLPFSITGDAGYFLVVNRREGDRFAASLREKGRLPEEAFRIGDDAEEILRLEAGIPLHRIDYDETTLILELAQGSGAISNTKGCFPGQEIVSRIQSRGSVKKKLVGLLFDSKCAAAAGMPLQRRGEEIGTIRSACDSPAAGSVIALADLKKPHYDDSGVEQRFEMGGSEVTGRVVHLPFYISAQTRAAHDGEYEAGMKAYHADEYVRAAGHFRNAVRLCPGNPDPFEALGMAIERSGDVDGAIAANQEFAREHPTSFMAHTNLSRLYMLKGMKEEAETEMGTSTIIQMRLGARTAKERDALEEEKRKEERAGRERRLSIFRQVLEMDPDDEVANFGIGGFYQKEGEYDRAIEHLQIVVNNNPEYSAAFALLGEALAKSGRLKEANDIYQRGIAVARERGDLMPLRKMQENMNRVLQ